VAVRPTNVAGRLGEGSLTINSPEQLGTSIADDEPSVEFDPVLATKRQGSYARSNRLTAPF
jgi:hypothetical protein